MTRLLVVEDEIKLACALEEGLGDAQFTVDVVGDGQAALDYAQTTRYDAIVLDVLLPRLTGLEVCRQLRDAGDRTPILILTARDAIEDRIAGLDSGADDYLVKPFAFGELLARLRALLRREATVKTGAITSGGLSLDPAAQVVTWGGQPVELTAREYRMLETLMRRPGWIVSRDAIVDSVWGFDYPDSSNLVDVYLGRLRRKLAAAGAPGLIRTLRGSGYRLQKACP